MTATVYLGRAGPLPLGRPIGRGGEGEVFALADASGRALKVYAQPDAAREAKVRSMVHAGLAASCPNVAFPEELAFRGDGSFAGFTMRLVDGCQAIHELYAPASRRRTFPGAEWRFLVRAALNTARMLDRVHAAGAVVGDINGSGVLVSRHAVVSLIDADSFQWGADHPCRVGVPEFTPPELQGRSLSEAIRTIDHDGFGLAVMVFELLFLGRHPHAGTPRGRDLPLARAIAQGAFAYSAVRQVALAPPRGTLLLTDLPPGLRVLFERAFAIGIGPRPLPAEWIGELGRLEATISPCTTNDRHARPAPDGKCPWCRIERITGSSLFGGDATVPTDTVHQPVRSPITTVAEGVLRRARAMSGDRLTPDRRHIGGDRADGTPRRPMSSGAHESAGEKGTGHAAGERLQTERRYLRERDHLSAVLDSWRSRVGAWKAHQAAELLAEELRRHDRIALRQAGELSEIEPRLTAERVGIELEATRLARASINGVGPQRIDILSACGMVTAADLSRGSLEALDGVGERTIVALLLWRDALAVSVGRRVMVSPDEVAAIGAEARRRHRAEIAASERILDAMARELERAIADLTVMAGRRDAELEEAGLAFGRTAAELRRLGPISPPSGAAPVDVVSALKVATAALSSSAKRKRRGGCPRCGAAMVKRWAGSGAASNRPFMGCTSFPGCTGTRPLRRRKP